MILGQLMIGARQTKNAPLPVTTTWIPLGYHIGTVKPADTADTSVLFFPFAVVIFGTTRIPLGYGKDTTLILYG